MFAMYTFCSIVNNIFNKVSKQKKSRTIYLYENRRKNLDKILTYAFWSILWCSMYGLSGLLQVI